MGKRRRGRFKRNRNKNKSQNKKRQVHADERAQRLAKFNNGPTSSKIVTSQNVSQPPKHLIAPSNLDLFNNPLEVITFFDIVNKVAKKGRNVFFDMSNVEKLSPPSILYLLSQIHHITSNNKPLIIKGNIPKNLDCQQLIETSGFYDHVIAERPTRKTKDIMCIQSGTLSEPLIAEKVKQFANRHLGVSDPAAGKEIYKTIIECMTNAKNHAYNDKVSKNSRWWLMATKDSNNFCVNFTFLDDGLGIPSTVRKKSTFERLITSDSEVVLSTLKGEFNRTRTELPGRGLGLPDIYNHFKSGALKNFKILTRKAFVNCADSEYKDLRKALKGTVFQWDYKLNEND